MKETYKKYDVFVIGSGIAGQTVAESCKKEGLTVAIADNRAFGGTCANRGCDPKKIILGITEVFKKADQLKGCGVKEALNISWEQTIQFKNEFTNPIPPSTEKKLKNLEIDLYHQSPSFIDKHSLLVEGKKIEANKIVIATGLHPRKLDIKGANLALTSDDFLELSMLPETMIFIGAGYIGMEFAHMAARFGVKVTIIERGDRPLQIFDKDLVKDIVKASEALGIQFIFNADILSIEELRKNKRVTYKINDEEASVKAELVFNTTGRVPAVESLALEKGEVSYGKNGIEVNSYLQNNSNQRVYACGDVSANAVPLTPFSTREGKIVAHNITQGNEQKADFPVTPSVAFTLPNIAKVGMTEEEAKEKIDDLKINHNDASSFYNAKRIRENIYSFKILIDQKKDVIVGAHLVGPEAGEIINLFAMAIHTKMTTDQVRNMIFTYPSWSGDIQYMI